MDSSVRSQLIDVNYRGGNERRCNAKQHMVIKINEYWWQPFRESALSPCGQLLYTQKWVVIEIIQQYHRHQSLGVSEIWRVIATGSKWSRKKIQIVWIWRSPPSSTHQSISSRVTLIDVNYRPTNGRSFNGKQHQVIKSVNAWQGDVKGSVGESVFSNIAENHFERVPLVHVDSCCTGESEWVIGIIQQYHRHRWRVIATGSEWSRKKIQIAWMWWSRSSSNRTTTSQDRSRELGLGAPNRILVGWWLGYGVVSDVYPRDMDWELPRARLGIESNAPAR